MPAPIITSNKFSQQVENNAYLRQKMQDAFYLAYQALNVTPLGALDTFTVNIDGIVFEYSNGAQIYINGNDYISLSVVVRKQAYDRLEKFMQIAIERYNTQYNL